MQNDGLKHSFNMEMYEGRFNLNLVKVRLF